MVSTLSTSLPVRLSNAPRFPKSRQHSALSPSCATLTARDYFCVFATEADVLNLKPDMSKVAALERFAVIVTAPGTDCDFVSRFFAPSKGVPETLLPAPRTAR